MGLFQSLVMHWKSTPSPTIDTGNKLLKVVHLETFICIHINKFLVQVYRVPFNPTANRAKCPDILLLFLFSCMYPFGHVVRAGVPNCFEVEGTLVQWWHYQLPSELLKYILMGKIWCLQYKFHLGTLNIFSHANQPCLVRIKPHCVFKTELSYLHTKLLSTLYHKHQKLKKGHLATPTF